MKGLIGFFDILGYQSFLKNNSAEEPALKVLEIITATPNEINVRIKKTSEKIGAQTGREVYLEIHSHIKHIVFSDTIVLTINYPDKADDKWLSAAFVIMSTYAGRLAADMFKSGLPLRGVVHEGDFFSKDMCLAGKGIVEAYHICESLNFSGIVFSPGLLEKEYLEIKTTNESMYRFNYLVPKKDGEESKMTIVDWIEYLKPEEELEKCERDIEDYVLEAFWAHQKDCANVVDAKIKNTVKSMRKMLQNKRNRKAD